MNQKRKDGGDYVAISSVYHEEMDDETSKHELCCGPMLRLIEDSVKVGAWSLSTEYDDREFGWEDNLLSDYVSFYQYIKGELPRVEGTLDKYVRLYDRGLLINIDGVDKINVVIQKIQGNWEEEFMKKFNAFASQISESLKEKIDSLVKKRVEIERLYFPKHMQEMLEIYRGIANVNIIKVIDELLESGVLKPLTDIQRKGAMIILYLDFIPLKDSV